MHKCQHVLYTIRKPELPAKPARSYKFFKEDSVHWDRATIELSKWRKKMKTLLESLYFSTCPLQIIFSKRHTVLLHKNVKVKKLIDNRCRVIHLKVVQHNL